MFKRVMYFCSTSFNVSSGEASGPMYIPKYFPCFCDVFKFSQFINFKRAVSAVVIGEKGMSRVLSMFRCNAEYCENLWNR